MLSFIKETLHSRKALFISATAMTILLKVSVFLPVILLGRIIDDLSAGSDANASGLTWLLAGLAFSVVLQSVIAPLHTYQLVSLVQLTLKEKSIQWTKAILGKEFEQFASLRLGGLIKAVERGITAHEKLLTFFITSGLPLIVESALVGVIFAYLGGGRIFLALLAVSAVYMGLYGVLVSWRRPGLITVNFHEDLVSSRLFETLHAGKTIKLENACDQALEPLCGSFTDYALAATKVASTGAVLGSVRILYLGLSTACLLAWGVQDQLSSTPRLTIGELVAVYSVAGMFLSNFSGLAEAYRAVDQFLVDKRRLQELLTLDDLIECVQVPPDFQVSSLSLAEAHPFPDQALHFYPEETVAIIGPSGAGKTTLLETLAGTLKARRLHLCLNGLQIQPADIAGYLSRVRYCPQNPVFLEGVFAHSVLFGQGASPALAQAVDALGLRHLIENRPVAEGAKNISGGEAKRLSLLRLINRPGDFNLFDEPTASLDPKAATLVWDTLFQHLGQRGLICATHDPQAFSRFDRVIVISHGAVVADGPWSELELCGDLARLLAQSV
jgi:ATP-binding cassette subfamily B protein/ATP-binding cassette subfamily B protein RtxE